MFKLMKVKMAIILMAYCLEKLGELAEGSGEAAELAEKALDELFNMQRTICEHFLAYQKPENEPEPEPETKDEEYDGYW